MSDIYNHNIFITRKSEVLIQDLHIKKVYSKRGLSGVLDFPSPKKPSNRSPIIPIIEAYASLTSKSPTHKLLPAGAKPVSSLSLTPL